VILAATVVVMLLASQPLQPPKEPGIAKGGSAQSAPNAKHRNTSQDPTQTSPPNALTTSQPSAQTGTYYADTNEENINIQGRIEIFTGVLAGVGLLQLGVMFLTWLVYRRQAREMRRQRHEMRRQRHVMFRQWKTMGEQTKLTAAQVEEMGRQTSVLATSVETARATAEAARDSVEMFISKERARLRIEVKPLSFVMQDRGLMDSVHYRVHFHGQTEAFVLESACYAVVNDSETLDITDDIVKVFKMDIPPVIGPSTVLPDRFTFLYHGPGLTLPQAARDEIANGKRFAHFYAFIKYRDVFDRTREIQLCYLWQVNLSLNTLLPKGMKGDKWVESGPPGTNRDT
jgi:hypothetical protein